MKNPPRAPLRDSYLMLGFACKAAHVWLARHLHSQQLVLVQRLAQPDLDLTCLLNCQLSWMPRILDYWAGDGSFYVVLQRVEGHAIDQIGSGGLCPRTHACLKGMLESLTQFGLQLKSPNSLCLDAQGSLRLRWLPGLARKSSSQAA